MNFFMKNMTNRYSDPDPLWNRIRIQFFQLLRKGGSEDPDPRFPNKDPDPDPRQNEMDPIIDLKLIHLFRFC